jgi:WS/DGAT/MGAT family acyltransferase
MERMSTLDAGFYFVEHRNVPMHLGSVVIFEGPAPSFAEVVQLYQAKLPRVPRYRQVVRTAPLQAFRPVWADDDQFDLARHMHHVTAPPPGTLRQLRNLAAKAFEPPLDRSRPLWEAWFVDGLADGRWALISKVHHCVVDGVGGNDLMTELFDAGPDASLPPGVPWAAEPEPSAASLLAGGVADAIRWPLRQAAEVPRLIWRRLPTPPAILAFGRGLASSARRLAVPSASSLNGPIGPHRRLAWVTAELAEVKQIRAALGGTVNDVLLAAITRGFRDLLHARGELAEPVVVRSLVPVSVRGPSDHGGATNRISAVLVNLPVSEPDPVLRLALLRRQMDEVKRTHQAVGAEFLTQMLGFAAPTVLALGSRAAFRLPQPLVQAVTTNVPGPRFPLYVLGRRMAAAYPFVAIGDNVRVSIAIFSYLDRFAFGITAERDATPDLSVLAGGIGRGLAELRRRAAGRRRGSGPPPAGIGV